MLAAVFTLNTFAVATRFSRFVTSTQAIFMKDLDLELEERLRISQVIITTSNLQRAGIYLASVNGLIVSGTTTSVLCDTLTDHN